MVRTLLAVIFSILFAAKASFATHIVGGEIYYTCLGNNNYRITLKVYRDCLNGQAPFDNPANIAIYTASGSLFTNLLASLQSSQLLEVELNNPCLQAPPNICVEEAIYHVEVNLPFVSGGYHVAYQRCCRNDGIVNLVNPGAQGSTYYVRIPELALNTCNSGPRFISFPPLALCIGEELIFDHSANDPDGDVLVYSLCTPYHGGSEIDPAPSPPDGPPYAQINWGSGYSSSDPIDASPALFIDPATGLLTGIPTQAGQYVVGVCVDEYRNGQLISTNSRDFQFNVVNCSSNVVAAIPSQQTFHDPCSGYEVTFGNISQNAQYYHWDFGIPGALDDTSNLEDPFFAFPDSGSYLVTLIANPGYPCADTTIGIIELHDAITAEIVSDGNLCFENNSFDFQAGGTFGPTATFLWEFENGNPATSSQQDPTGIAFATLGTYTVSLTVTEDICSDQDEIEVQTYPPPQAFFEPDTLRGCAPLGVLLLDGSTSATPHQSLWNLGDGTTFQGDRVLHAYTEPGTYSVSLTVWTNSGCIDTSVFTVTNMIEVLPLPSGELTVDPDTQFVFDPAFVFQGTTDAGIYCGLYTGDGLFLNDTSGTCTIEHFYSDTGTYTAIMVFTDANGCQVFDTAVVRVEPEVRFWLPNAFTPNGDRINDSWGPKAFGFSEYELWIYDRWGKQMFYSIDPFEQWNGTFNNEGNHEPVPGVYAYRILARSVKSDVIRELGSVILVR